FCKRRLRRTGGLACPARPRLHGQARPPVLRGGRRISNDGVLLKGPTAVDRIVVEPPADDAPAGEMIEDVPRQLVPFAERDERQAADRIEQENVDLVELFQSVLEFRLGPLAIFMVALL